MATLIEALTILDKMQTQQRFAKQLLQEKYHERVSDYIKYVRDVMERDCCDEIHAVMKMCEDPEVAENSLAVALLMSAAIEISKQP
jgi:hypothetical protein